MLEIDHNYLPQQFADIDGILENIRAVVKRGDFTLGEEVALFEQEYAKMVGVKHAIGVGNGTDAIFLALKALGVRHGNQRVITTPYSFYATTSMIVQAGATPVFADVGRDFNIDPAKIEERITERTVGIVPVHWAGRPCNMDAIMEIAKRHHLWVLEDCAHAPNATYHGKKCGSFGAINTFSLHPLKNVNVWGDGGVIATDDDQYAAMLRKLRNHGMTDRNTCEFWGFNSRLDTVQAVVGRHVLGNIERTTMRRRENAHRLDELLSDIPQVELPVNAPNTKPNYYLYSFHAENREELKKYLVGHGVDAKVHYPIPLHLQPAAQFISSYRKGDYPMAEWCADSTLSLPVHDYLQGDQVVRMGQLVRSFYGMPS